MESALWADDDGEYADDAPYSPVRHQQQGRVMMLKRKIHPKNILKGLF